MVAIVSFPKTWDELVSQLLQDFNSKKELALTAQVSEYTIKNILAKRAEEPEYDEAEKLMVLYRKLLLRRLLTQPSSGSQ